MYHSNCSGVHSNLVNSRWLMALQGCMHPVIPGSHRTGRYMQQKYKTTYFFFQGELLRWEVSATVTACTHLRKNVRKVPSSTNVKKRKNITKPKHRINNRARTCRSTVVSHTVHTPDKANKPNILHSPNLHLCDQDLDNSHKTWTTLQTDATLINIKQTFSN